MEQLTISRKKSNYSFKVYIICKDNPLLAVDQMILMHNPESIQII